MGTYNPATHEALYQTATATEKLWCADKTILDLAHTGLVDVIVLQTTPAVGDRNKIWLSPFTAGSAEGVVKAWDGTTWSLLTPALLRAHLGAASTDASSLVTGTLVVNRLPAFSGDVTSPIGSSALTLANTTITAGTYTNASVTFDAKGRATSATSGVTLGTAATLNVGTAVGDIIQVQVGGKLPALDGSLLTGISGGGSANTDASLLTSGTLPTARLPAFTGDATTTAGSSALTLASTTVTAGSYTNASVTVDAKGRVTAASNGAVLGTAAALNVGTTVGDLIQVQAGGKLPALDGSLLTGLATTTDASLLSSGTLSVARLPAHTGDVTSSAGSAALTLASTTVTAGSYTNASVTFDAKGRATAASNGTPTGTAAALNVGTAVGNVVQVQTGGKLPALDGSLLTGLATTTDASQLITGTLAAARLPAHTGDVTSTVGSAALTLASTTVTAGTYTNATVTFDAKGRATSATSGAGFSFGTGSVI
jgi:trimeric autotransporter adhesin